MKSLKTYIMLGAVLLSAPVLLPAQKVYTIVDCRRMALDNNIKIKNGLVNIEQAKEQEKEAFSKYFPTVSASGTYFRSSDYLIKEKMSISPSEQQQLANTITQLGLNPSALSSLPNSFTLQAIDHATSHRDDFNTINAFDFNYGMTGQIELPLDMQFSTDITMFSRRGYQDKQMNTDKLVWNARLSKRLFHGNLILMADGFDILRNLSNVQRILNAQGRTETFYNVVPRYVMFHAIYRFNSGPKK